MEDRLKYLLDTDVCVAILRGEHELERKVRSQPIQTVGVCSIVSAELWVGVHKANQKESARSRVSLLLETLPSLPFDEPAARVYGEIRARLEKDGRTIGGNDLLIAAIAVTHGSILVSRNQTEYRRVAGLKSERW